MLRFVLQMVSDLRSGMFSQALVLPSITGAARNFGPMKSYHNRHPIQMSLINVSILFEPPSLRAPPRPSYQYVKVSVTDRPPPGLPLMSPTQLLFCPPHCSPLPPFPCTVCGHGACRPSLFIRRLLAGLLALLHGCYPDLIALGGVPWGCPCIQLQLQKLTYEK